MARVNWLCLFFLAQLVLGDAAKPISNMNLDDFEHMPSTNDAWGKNPFSNELEAGTLKKPKLTMIVYGRSQSAALINNQPLQKGDRLGNLQVTSIHPSEVILRGPDGLMHLRIENSKSKSGKSGYQIALKDAPLGDAVKLLASLQHKNVVMPSKLDDLVTASFPKVALESGMKALLESRGYSAFEKDNVVRIVTIKEQEALGADLTTKVIPLKYAKAKDIKDQVAQLVSPRGKVMIDERTNTLTILDSPSYQQNVENFINSVDNVDQQVLIEARVVDATDEFVQSLGIQWGVKMDTSNLKMNGIGSSTGSSAAPAASGKFMDFTRANNPLFGLAVGIPFSNNQLDLELSAAETDNKATILSRPSIITMNNQPATIHSGQKVFITVPGAVGINPGGTLGSVGNLQQVAAGITMVATPQITVDGKIRLSVDVTASSFKNTGNNNQNIEINDNNAKTQILLSDGETTVLGGLYQSDNQKGRGGVPLLSRIPFIGALFRNSQTQKKKRELLVFIKPTIVKTAVKEIDRTKEEAVSPFEDTQETKLKTTR